MPHNVVQSLRPQGSSLKGCYARDSYQKPPACTRHKIAPWLYHGRRGEAWPSLRTEAEALKTGVGLDVHLTHTHEAPTF
jgi:hypothetical protein